MKVYMGKSRPGKTKWYQINFSVITCQNRQKEKNTHNRKRKEKEVKEERAHVQVLE
jgi:hypothetical protein